MPDFNVLAPPSSASAPGPRKRARAHRAGKQSTGLFSGPPHPPRAGALRRHQQNCWGKGLHHKVPRTNVGRPPGGQALPFVASGVIRPAWLTPCHLQARRDGRKTRARRKEYTVSSPRLSGKPSVLRGIGVQVAGRCGRPNLDSSQHFAADGSGHAPTYATPYRLRASLKDISLPSTVSHRCSLADFRLSRMVRRCASARARWSRITSGRR